VNTAVSGRTHVDTERWDDTALVEPYFYSR
jgi:hypothetical protein